MSKTMTAWVIERTGGPEVYKIAQVPIPEPGEGEVQVRVEGAGMNPVDWKIREGLFPPAAPKEFPAVTLREFSGTVTKLGPGVTSVQVGDGVYGITNIGAAAEYTVARESAIGRRPATLTAAEAAIVPLAGMTAWQALFDHGGLEPGQRALIHAAAGGVGSYAVQLAKWKGAYVIGTASAHHHETLRQLGADELIDYRAQRFEDVVHDVDLVLHSIGQDQLPASLSVLKPGGILVAISADPMEEEAKRQGKRSMVFMMQPNSDQLRRLAELIDQGAVRPVIEEIVPLDQATEAMMELQEGHVLGKIGVSLM